MPSVSIPSDVKHAGSGCCKFRLQLRVWIARLLGETVLLRMASICVFLFLQSSPDSVKFRTKTALEHLVVH